jgi:hypothetical protein
MNKLLLLCLVSCLSLQLIAQQNEIDKRFDIMKLESAIKKKRTGVALTAGGTALLVIGIIVGSNSSYNTTSTYGGPTQTSTTGSPGLAAASILFGAAGLGIGIPLWSVGAHREKKLRNSGVSLSFAPHANGATLRLRF